jgi:WD40 repeat protein
MAFLDGKTLVAPGADGTCRVWDLTGPQPRPRSVFPAYGELYASAPDGKDLLQVNHLTGGVSLWDLAEVAAKRPKKQFASRSDVNPGCKCALSPDGSRLALGYGDGTLSVWDLKAGEPRPIQKPTVARQFLAATPDGATLATVSGEGDVQFWDLTTSPPRVIVERHGAGVPLPYLNAHGSIGAMLPDGSGLALLDGQIIHLWKRTPNVLQDWQRLSVPEKPLRTVAISPDGALLVAPSLADGTVWAWDLKAAEFRPRQVASFPVPVLGQAFVPGTRVLIVARADRGIDRLDLSTEKPAPRPIRKPRGNGTHFHDVYVSVGSVVAHAVDEPWRVFDLALPEVQEGQAWDGPVTHQPLSFSPDGRTCIGVRRDGVSTRLALWDWPSRRLRTELPFPGEVAALQITADGRHVLTGNLNGTVYVLRLARAVGTGGSTDRR